jgi:hypothetical protein
MPYACIDPQTLDHFCSDYKINPDTGLVRFEAPKTKGPPFPDYDEEESETAEHLGRLCDRVYPHGKSAGLGEFGEEYDMGEPGEDEEEEIDEGDDSHEEPRDPRRRSTTATTVEQPRRRSILKNSSNQQRSNRDSDRVAKQGQREVESPRYRESRFTAKRNTGEYPRSPHSKQRAVVYDSANRRKQREYYDQGKFYSDRHIGNYDEDGEPDEDYEIDANGAYYERERKPVSRRLTMEEQYARDRRNGFRAVRFKRGRARARAPEPTYSTASDIYDDDDVIILDNEPLPHRTKPPSRKQRSFSTFEPVEGTTTADEYDSAATAADDEEGATSDSSDASGKPLEDLENFWQS